MRISKVALVLFFAISAIPAFAQGRIYKGSEKEPEPGGWQNLGPSGTWWRSPAYVSRLSLTTDQQKRMDDVFQQARIKLIDLTATLDKEEITLEMLLKVDRLDELRVGAQLDKVADARAGLEKANGRMLLSIRQVLTPEQWTTLNSSKLGGAYEYYKAKGTVKQKQ